LELSYRLGRRVTLAEFGELIAKESGRNLPFTAAAVSRWEKGLQIPSLDIIEAIGRLTGTDPGWLSHGDRTAAPAPRLLHQEPQPTSPVPAAEANAQEFHPKVREAEESVEREGIAKKERLD
jgi:transcriptional regulator with XRE-family HTH domain